MLRSILPDLPHADARHGKRREIRVRRSVNSHDVREFPASGRRLGKLQWQRSAARQDPDAARAI